MEPWDTDDAELLEAAWQFQRNFEAATIPSGRQEAEPDAASDGSS